MTFEVINNPAFIAKTGFTKVQFRKLDDLFCRAVAAKALIYRTVECDFEEAVAQYTYYKSEFQVPSFQFVIRKVGPRDMMYEVFAQGRGMIVKSGVFDRAFEKLQSEIEALF